MDRLELSKSSWTMAVNFSKKALIVYFMTLVYLIIFLFKADPHIKDSTGASPIDFVTKRNLFFCNSIIEICVRNFEKKGRVVSLIFF